MERRLWPRLVGGWLALVVLGGPPTGTRAAEPDPPAQVVQRLIQALGNVPTGPGQPPPGTAVSSPVALLDLPGISQQALGTYWDAWSPQKQQRFVAVLTQLLDHVVVRKTARLFQRLEVAVTTERITGAHAVVSTTMQHPQEGLLALEYRLTQHGQTWRVRDVLLDGVSLVQGLRAQFHQILTTSSVDALLHRMQQQLIGLPVPAAPTREPGDARARDQRSE